MYCVVDRRSIQSSPTPHPALPHPSIHPPTHQANDAGVLGLEAAVGVGGVVGLGLLEAQLAAPGASAARYALWTTLPSFAPGVAASTFAQQSPGAEAEAAAQVLLRLRNVQAARQVLALATLLGVSWQATASAARGRQRYRDRVAEGREPPLAPPAAIRVSDRPPAPSAAAFHVAVARGPEDVAPWAAGAASPLPQRWWTRPGWIGDPREWRPLVQGVTASAPVFLEAAVSSPAAAGKEKGGVGVVPLELALEGLRAGGRAAALSSGSAVRVLLGGGEPLKAGSATRRAVEESGSVDLLLDGEAAVAMAVLAWVEKTPYARAWAALAAQQARGEKSTGEATGTGCMYWSVMFCITTRTTTEEEARLSAREGNPVWNGYERASELLEAALDAPYVGPPLHWMYRSLEGLGRRVRWLVKGGVTVGAYAHVRWLVAFAFTVHQLPSMSVHPSLPTYHHSVGRAGAGRPRGVQGGGPSARCRQPSTLAAAAAQGHAAGGGLGRLGARHLHLAPRPGPGRAGARAGLLPGRRHHPRPRALPRAGRCVHGRGRRRAYISGCCASPALPCPLLPCLGFSSPSP